MYKESETKRTDYFNSTKCRIYIRLMKEVDEIPNEFYELEPLEVVEVHIDDSKPSFPKKDGGPDYTYLVVYWVDFVNSEQGVEYR